MEMGIYSGSGALTAQQKVLAAQQVILEQTSLAQGDFARTSDGLANSQRQIEAAVKDAQAQLGQALLPVMLELATFTEQTLVPALSAFIAGLTGNGSMTDGFNQSQLAAVEWGKKARMVFDALVALKEVAAAVAITLASIWAVSKVQAAVVATIGFVNLLIKAYNALKASAIVAAVASRLALNPLAGAAASAAIFAVIGAAAKLASDFDTQAASSSQSYNQQRENQIAGAGASGGGGSTIPGTSSGGITFPSITGGVIGGGSSSGGGIKIKPAPTLIEQVSQEQFIKNMAPGNFDPGRFRQADNNINITVNGAVDPVGTARQIATILNTEASTAGSFTNLGVSRFATRAE
jgi:hypothetical protein